MLRLRLMIVDIKGILSQVNRPARPDSVRRGVFVTSTNRARGLWKSRIKRGLCALQWISQFNTKLGSGAANLLFPKRGFS